MTGLEVQARAEYILDDTIDLNDVLTGINLGLHDLAVEAPRMGIEELILAASNRSVTIPSDCLSIDQIFIGSAELEELDSPFSQDTTATGTPKDYFLVGNELRLFPLADAQYTVSLLVQKDYGVVTDLSQEIVNLPVQFHMALVYWLLSQFKYYDDELEEASFYTNEYYRYRTSLKTYQENRTNYSAGIT
jgi:hypothetical protein